MPKSRQPNKISIEEIRILYNRANEHNLYVDEEGRESRKLEAFLMLATLLEGVLTSFGLISLEKRGDLSALRGKRKKRYGIDNAINDLYLLGKISTEEFSELERFKDARNKCVHEIFGENEQTEKHTSNLFKIHTISFENILAKFIKEL